MPDNYTIRALSSADIATILRLRKLMFLEDGVPPEAFIDDIDLIQSDFYTANYEQGEMIHFAAEMSSGEPIAIVGATLKRDFPYYLFKPGYYGWIIDVYTLPEYRGGGIASHLIEYAHEWLRGKGVQEAKLIAAGTDAQRLYTRLGYRPTWEMSKNLSGEKTYNELLDSH